MAVTLTHSKYKIHSDLGKITIVLSDNHIAKYYKFNDQISIGLDKDQDTVTIELRYSPEFEKKKNAPIEVILKHRNK